ncbi:MAG: hypothetical protein RIS35_633 [Pseudomonadota bacterium]
MLTLNITGMTCGHCVKAVTRAVQELDAEAKVAIDLAQGRAEIDSHAAADAIVAAITEEGYEVVGRSEG